MDWCHHVGAKLIDETISVDEVMLNFIRPEEVQTPPELVPLALEWTWDVASGTSEQVRLEIDGSAIPLIDADLEILGHDRVGPIIFQVVCGTASAAYTLTLGNGQMDFAARSIEAEVVTREKRTPLSQFLNQRGVYVHRSTRRSSFRRRCSSDRRVTLPHSRRQDSRLSIGRVLI